MVYTNYTIGIDLVKSSLSETTILGNIWIIPLILTTIIMFLISRNIQRHWGSLFLYVSILVNYLTGSISSTIFLIIGLIFWVFDNQKGLRAVGMPITSITKPFKAIGDNITIGKLKKKMDIGEFKSLSRKQKRIASKAFMNEKTKELIRKAKSMATNKEKKEKEKYEKRGYSFQVGKAKALKDIEFANKFMKEKENK